MVVMATLSSAAKADLGPRMRAERAHSLHQQHSWSETCTLHASCHALTMLQCSGTVREHKCLQSYMSAENAALHTWAIVGALHVASWAPLGVLEVGLRLVEVALHFALPVLLLLRNADVQRLAIRLLQSHKPRL